MRQFEVFINEMADIKQLSVLHQIKPDKVNIVLSGPLWEQM